jgi:hypothetical protein
MPRWDLEKFKGAEEKIGSAMKSVGEVMAIGRSFEEALQKAVRMQSGQIESVTDNAFKTDAERKHFLEVPTPKRLFAIADSMKKGVTKILMETFCFHSNSLVSPTRKSDNSAEKQNLIFVNFAKVLVSSHLYFKLTHSPAKCLPRPTICISHIMADIMT